MWRRQRVSPHEVDTERAEAFLTACAMHAGQRERDLTAIVEAIGRGKPEEG